MSFIYLTVLVFVFAFIYGKPSEVEARIVGGEEVDIEDYPYQVSIQISGEHWCGGSIISQTSILTAAHCTDIQDLEWNITIRAGSSIHNSGGVEVEVDDIVQHSSYTYVTLGYDIAILNLETPLTYGSGIQPIDLAGSRPMDNTRASTSGWGYESVDAVERSLHLRAVDMYTVNLEDCQYVYTDFYANITDGVLCAYRLYADNCYNDDGGPLAVRTPTSYTLIGIVSWGVDCARPRFPRIYTDVSTFLEWIKENMISD